RSALCVIAVGDEVLLPHHPRCLRILIPPESVQHPPCRDHIRGAIMVHVECPLSTVGDELPENAYGSVLMAFPLAARRPRVFIPIGSAQEVGPTVAIHVERGDAFGMIRTQTVSEESHLRNVPGRIPRSGLTRVLFSSNAEARRPYGHNERNCK